MAKQGAKEAANPTKQKEISYPSLELSRSSIKIPKIETPFEINPAIISIIQSSVQFHGLPHEDPYRHIADFSHICTTFKVNDVSEDTIKLILFPFSLADEAKDWLYYYPEPESITTWDQLVHEFLAEYFPASKTNKLRDEILNFRSCEREQLHKAWRQYKVLLKKCPHHGFPLSLRVQNFYAGLDSDTQDIVDQVAGGSFMGISVEERYALLQRLAAKTRSWG